MMIRNRNDAEGGKNEDPSKQHFQTACSSCRRRRKGGTLRCSSPPATFLKAPTLSFPFTSIPFRSPSCFFLPPRARPCHFMAVSPLICVLHISRRASQRGETFGARGPTEQKGPRCERAWTLPRTSAKNLGGRSESPGRAGGTRKFPSSECILLFTSHVLAYEHTKYPRG